MRILSYVFTLCLCMIVFSCKKEITRENCILIQNIPPIAKAGRDTIIILPINSVILNGNRSIDPDGKITSYLWLQVSGPGTALITNQEKALATANNLSEGLYSFALQVTDDVGLSSRDTLTVTVALL
jgi:hypothetical protein